MKLYFDIGCNVGHWIHANHKEGIRIIGVEANPTKAQEAKERFADNPDIEILNFAVSNRDGDNIDIHVSNPDWATTASSDFRQHGRFSILYATDPIKVPTITIDTLIKQYGEPEYIKIDVESYELTALQGLAHKSGMIAFEWMDEIKADVFLCIDYCYSLGYRDFAILINSDDYLYIPNTWQDYDIFRQLINDTLDVKRMFHWGMIYCK